MKQLIVASLFLMAASAQAASTEPKSFRFRLMSVTCQLEDGRFITASCKTLSGRWKSFCSIDHIGSAQELNAQELKTGKYHVAPVGENQYITYSEDAGGASVCMGAGSESKKVIVTGEMIDKVEVKDLK